MKKVAVFLCFIQSSRTNQIIHPKTIPSYHLIEDLCDDASKHRKAETHDRKVLNIAPVSDARRKNKVAVQMTYLDKNEIKLLVETCIDRMNDIMLEMVGSEMEAEEGDPSYIDKPMAQSFTNYLMTVSFVALLGPRTQVLRQV